MEEEELKNEEQLAAEARAELKAKVQKKRDAQLAREKAVGLKQIHWRYREREDIVVFRKLLQEADLSFQHFCDACVQAFIRGDRAILQVIRDWRILGDMYKESLSKSPLSVRERMALLDQIEKEDPKKQS